MSKAGGKKTVYNPDWEDAELYPVISKWIKKDCDSHYFRCKFCPGSRLSLSNMGITALLSHMKDQKGKEGETIKCKHNRNKESMQSIKQGCFFKSNNNAEDSMVSTAAETATETNEVINIDVDAGIEVASEPTQKQRTIRLDTASKEVVECWILWALDVIHSHRSMNNSGSKGKMFPNDSNAANFGDLSATKLTYIINFGLAVYFKETIMKELAPRERLPPRFTSAFDESFNKVTYSKQMDIHLFYFNEKSRQVNRVYIGSQFMGHATANDTMKDFKAAHKDLDIVTKLIQLSMDGPNVNWKFHDDLEEYRQEQNPQAPLLLALGSCGLHVLHGAFGTAHSKTDWDVQKVLKAVHGVFKKSPARRADYLEDNGLDWNGEDNQLKMYFPIKFCGHRWCENGKALTRYLEIDTKVKTFMVTSEEKKRKNFDAKDERKPLLLGATQSKIFPAYCEFSLSICREIEPFLSLYQAERPLCVFLYSSLVTMILGLMRRFVKKQVIQDNSTPAKFLKLDLRKEDNLLPVDSVDIGFGAKRVMKGLKTIEKTQERKFRLMVRSFLATFLDKVFERSPLKYKLTRPISSLSPLEISSKSTEILEQRFTKLLDSLIEHAWITTSEAEKAQKQYRELLGNKGFMSEAAKFDIYTDRVDDFWAKVLDSAKTIDLENIVWLILILSHGNARVESGFSINGDILLANMLPESVVAQRLVYEAVSKAGDATKVDISPGMIKLVRESHKRFNQKQQEKRASQSENQKKVAAKRRKDVDMKKKVEEKKAKMDEMKEMVKLFDKEIVELQSEMKK